MSYQLFPQELMSEEAFVAAVHLTPETRAWLKNRMYEVAQQKLLLTYDATNPNVFIQAEAELQGRLRELMQILDAENQLQGAVNDVEDI